MKFRPIAKVPKHKRFDYEPRYYDPEKEKRNRRRKVNFERKTRRGNQGRSIIIYIILLSGLFWYLLS